CAKINDPAHADLADGCVDVAAETAKDPSMCSKAVDPNTGQLCIRNVAVAKGDPSVCNLITNDEEFKNSCIEWVADAKKDPSICDSMTNESMKARCKGLAG